jgi:hypothetical protein
MAREWAEDVLRTSLAWLKGLDEAEEGPARGLGVGRCRLCSEDETTQFWQCATLRDATDPRENTRGICLLRR